MHEQSDSMMRRHSLTAIPLCLLLLGFIQIRLEAMASAPEILQKLDTRPDRGNQEGSAYVTGPRSQIGKLYNGDLEISFWNQPSEMTFSLAKNDVWDRRYFGDRKKIITIEDVRRVCFSGNIGGSNDLGLPDTPQALYSAYDFPCPKPVGQIIIRCPDIKGHDEYVAGKASGGTLAAKASKGKTRAALWAFLHKTQNLMVIRGEYAGLTQPLQIQLYRHMDTTPQETSVFAIANRGGKTGYDYAQDPDNGPLPPPKAGTDGRFFWIRQTFPAEKTFPNGFEYVLMGVIKGEPYEVKAENNVKGAGAKSVIHPIGPEVYKRLPGWLKEVRIADERLNDAEYGSLAAASIRDEELSFTLFVTVVTTRDASDPFASGKKILLDALRDGPDTVAQRSAAATEAEVSAWRLSRVMHYNATSCTYADSTPWHGDYHFNEGYFLPTIVNGDTDALTPRLKMFEEMLPAISRNAREVYNCRGICFPLVHYPIKHDRVVYANVTWEWGIENTAFMLQPYWHIFQYTQDKKFLRKRAYPMMVGGARFYEDYVAKGDDGCYHVIPTVSQEHWGFTPNFRLNRDSVGALSFIKYHLKACIQASEILGVDAEERERWRDIVEHLAPYPVLQTEDGPVFCDVRDAPRLLNYNITANLIMVLWAEDISVDSPPDILEMARRSYRAIPDREHSPRKGYLRRIELYLGMLEKPFLSPQGRVLSWPGRIHLYAGVPNGVSLNDSFSGLLAVGAFEVSAVHVGTEVRRVRIKSRVGGACKVKSPWHPADVKVMDYTTRDIMEHTMADDNIIFETQAGHTYALLSGPEIARADMRFAAEEKMIGKWTFDREENGLVPDESGCGHHAKLLDGAALASVEGGKALKLVGPKSYARVERAPAFDFAPNRSFSVKARIKVVADPATYMIPIVCSMATRQYCLMLSRGRAKFYLSSPVGDVYCFAEGKTILTDGRWHTLRGVRDATDETVKIYVDNKLEGMAGDVTAGDFSSTAPITIGAYLWGSHTRFGRGLIDDVEIKSF